MDWVIEAARRKYGQPAGGSRSIVESLDLFNNIDTDFEVRINSILNRSGRWIFEDPDKVQPLDEDRSVRDTTAVPEEDRVPVQDEVNESSATKISIDHKTALQEPRSASNIASPESKDNTKNHGDDPDVISEVSMLRDILSTTAQDSANSQPVRPIVSATITADNVETSSPERADQDSVTHKQLQKSPAWSPFRVDQTLKNPTTRTHPIHDAKSSIRSPETVAEEAPGDKYENKVEVSKTLNFNVPNSEKLRSPSFAINRIKRRSNMFVPLPKKDPLTIQLSGRPDNNNDTKRVVDLIPEVDGDNYATVDAESVSPTVTTTLFGDSNMSEIPSLRAVKSNNTSPQLVYKNGHTKLIPEHGSTANFTHATTNLAGNPSSKHVEKNLPVANSPTKHTSRRINPNENVFDRLSSHLTKSYENKARRKIQPRRHGPSSIDLSGSPKNRQKPPTRGKRNYLADTRAREALRNIFSEHQPPKVQPKQLTSTVKDMAPRQLAHFKSQKNSGKSLSKNSSDLPEPTQKNVIKEDQFSTSSQTVLAQEEVEKVKQVIELGLSKDARYKGVRRSVSRKDVNENTEKNQKAIIDSKDIKSPDGNPKSSTAARRVRNNSLTKIPLLRSTNTGKQALIQKVNKRLSDVMKTKLEQERVGKSLQRRTSVIKPESRRRSRTFSDFKGFGTMARPVILRGTNDNNDISVNGASGGNYLGSLRTDRAIVGQLTDIPNVDDKNNIGSGEGVNTSNILGTLDTEDYRIKIYDPHGNREGNNRTRSGEDDDTLPEIYSDFIDNDNTTFAQWAQMPYLMDQLVRQQNFDYRKIFGPLTPIRMEEIFSAPTQDILKQQQDITRKS